MVDYYTVKDPVDQMDPARFRKRLQAFLSTAQLDLTRPAVVVADKTRLCGYPLYLPVLLDTLAEYGARPEKITIYIAYGTHLPQDDQASQRAYGEVFNRYRWVHHDCEKGPFIKVGTTRRGTTVNHRADMADASCWITFGAISHHYFAGYGGGRKLIFPGLGKKEDIYANHGLFLDRAARRLASGCRSGRISGNPLAEDLAEIESFRRADLAVHGILDSHGQVCDLLVGRGNDHFDTACAMHAASCEVAAERSYDLVIASCGGFPKDINFIQSHKAIHHAADFVCDGGRLILLAQCRDGIGSRTFMPWFDLGGWNGAFDRLAHRYMGNGGTALAMMAKVKRIKISLVTDLSPDLAKTIGFERITPSQAQADLDRHRGELAVIANASMVVRKFQGS